MITNTSFAEQLPLVIESINNADYVAIDCEFSGHTASLESAMNDYDTIEEKYQKLRCAINRFIAFQVGICTYTWCDEGKKYLYRPFCFYVWPSCKLSDRSMMFQSSAVSFLVKNNFDFNMLFDKGVPFSRLTKKSDLNSLCTQKITRNFQSTRSFSMLSKTHQMDLEQLMIRVDKFVYNPMETDSITFEIESYPLKKGLAKKITERFMSTGIFTEFGRGDSSCTVKKSKNFKQANFLRDIKAARNGDDSILGANLGFQPSAFEDEEMEERKVNEPHKDSKLGGKATVETVDEAMKNSVEDDTDGQIEKMVSEELGFSQVIEALIKARKPIIGHNAIYDLAFIYHQFYNELPDTYAEFAHKTSTVLFPKFYDTKVLSLYVGKLGKSDLATLYYKSTKDKRLSNSLNFAPDPSHAEFAIYQS